MVVVEVSVVELKEKRRICWVSELGTSQLFLGILAGRSGVEY